MVMPCYNVVYPTGCIGSVRTTVKQTHLIMYVDPAEIRKLHRYFAGPSTMRPGKTIADDILDEGADFGATGMARTIGPCAVVQPTQARRMLRVYRIRKGATRPSEVKKFPHHMQDGWYYWARKQK